MTSKSSLRPFVLFLLPMLIAACDDSSRPAKPSITTVLDFAWRASLADKDTAVLIMTNKSNVSLENIAMKLEDQTTLDLEQASKDDSAGLYSRHAEFTVQRLAPGAKKEIGVLETGWLLKPDTVITLSHESYEPESVYFYLNSRGKMVMSVGYASKKGAQLTEKLHEIFK